MVAMIDPRSLSTMFVVERNAAAQPLTVTLVGPAQAGKSGQPGLYRVIGVDVEPVGLFEGEPTWEDAEWQ